MIKHILLVLTALAAPAFGQSGFAVVVGKANPATRISKAQLRRMVLGEMNAWPTGGKVSVMIASAGDIARAAMLKEICGMTESDFGKYIAQKAFSGDSTAPKVLPSTSVVAKVVKLSAGSLGIVSTADVTDDVKLLPVE